MKEATFTRGSRKTTAFGDKQGRESDYSEHCTLHRGETCHRPLRFSRHPPPPPSPPRQSTNCCAQYIDALPRSPECREWWWWTSIVSPSGNRYITPFAPSSSVRKLDTPLFDSLSPSPPPLPPPFTNDKSMLTTWRKGKEGGCIRRGIEQRRRSPLTSDLQIPLFRISTLPCSTGEKFWLHRRSDICGKTLARVEWRTPRSFHLHR